MKDFIFILGFMFFSVVFTSCTEKIGVKHNTDNSITLSLSSKSSQNFDSLIKSLSGTDKLFDEAEIAAELKERKGEKVAVKTGKGASIDMETTFSASEKDALSPLFEQTNSGKSFTLTLSKETISQFLSLLPSETQDYTELLLAPVFTGEKMSKSEYIQTLAAVYGNDIANEMQSAKLEFSVTSKSGVKQSLNLALAEILCLRETKKYTFDW